MNIDFISYDGTYPNLCRGTLVLEIDGKTYTFGGYNYDNVTSFPRFWSSGGSVWFTPDWDANVSSGRWIINEDELPDFLKPYSEQLSDIFNEFVDYGCCGGCI